MADKRVAGEERRLLYRWRQEGERVVGVAHGSTDEGEGRSRTNV